MIYLLQEIVVDSATPDGVGLAHKTDGGPLPKARGVIVPHSFRVPERLEKGIRKQEPCAHRPFVALTVCIHTHTHTHTHTKE